MKGSNQDAFRGLGPLERLWTQIRLAIEYMVRQGVAEIALLEQRICRLAPSGVYPPCGQEPRLREFLAIRFDQIHIEALCLMRKRAMRLDLLAETLGVSPAEGRQIADVCLGLGLIESERILAREHHPWLWPTAEGLLAAGFASFHQGPPRLGMLAYLETLAQIRITYSQEGQPSSVLWRTRKHLRSTAERLAACLADYAGYELTPKPGSSLLASAGLEWVSEDECPDLAELGCGRPDAMLRSPQEEIALLVAPRFSDERMIRHVDQLAARCTAVACLFSPSERRWIRRAKNSVNASNVHFVELGRDGRPPVPYARSRARGRSSRAPR